MKARSSLSPFPPLPTPELHLQSHAWSPSDPPDTRPHRSRDHPRLRRPCPGLPCFPPLPLFPSPARTARPPRLPTQDLRCAPPPLTRAAEAGADNFQKSAAPVIFKPLHRSGDGADGHPRWSTTVGWMSIASWVLVRPPLSPSLLPSQNFPLTLDSLLQVYTDPVRGFHTLRTP